MQPNEVWKAVNAKAHNALALCGFSIFFALILSAQADDVRAAYMADSYIESDGTQCIDIGYVPKQNSRFEVEYSILTTNDTRNLFGAADHSGSAYTRHCGLYFQTVHGVSAQRFGCGDNWDGWAYTDAKLIDQRFTASLDLKSGKGQIRLAANTNLTVNCSALTADMTNTLMIFAKHGYGEGVLIDKPANARIYWFKVYEGDVLKVDLIPYSRAGVTGFLDRLSGRVHVGCLDAGNPLKFGTDAAFVSAVRAEMPGLSTGYLAGPKTKVEIDFALTDTTIWQRIFGNDEHGDFRCGLYVGNGTYIGRFGDGDKTGTAANTDIAVSGERRVVVIDGPAGTMTIRKYGTEKVESTRTFDLAKASKKATVPLAIFGDCASATGETFADIKHPCGMRLYGMKIWEDGVLQHNYEPRIVDSVVAIYDTETASVLNPTVGYHNALTPGGDVLCCSLTGKTPVCDAYLEGKKGPVINTGYYAKGTTKVEGDYTLIYAATNLNVNVWGFNLQKKAGKMTRLYHYIDKPTSVKWCVGQSADGTTDTGAYPSIAMAPSIMERGSTVCDVPSQSISFTRAGSLMKNTFAVSVPADYGASAPFAVYSFATGESSYSANKTSMRLYELKFSESETVVHDYVPAGFAGKVGLYDMVSGDFRTNVVQGVGDFTLGGAGVGGSGMVFSKHPQGAEIEIDGSVTLTAFAPGAMGLQWLRNGEPIVGETGPSLKVNWAKSPKSANYQCLAYYAIYGYALSDSAVVKSKRRGLLLMFR